MRFSAARDFNKTLNKAWRQEHFSVWGRMVFIQKVNHPRHIVDAFEQLWNALLTSLLEKEEYLSDILINSYANLILCCLACQPQTGCCLRKA